MVEMRLTDKYDTWVYKHTLEELEEIYRDDLRFSRNQLEKASQTQHTKFEKWYSALEDIEGDIRDLESKIKRKRAEVSLLVHRKYSDLKVAAIAAKVDVNKDIKTMEQELNLLKRYQGKVKGAVESARQRKSMIQVLKDLYMSNYWDKTTEGGQPIHGRRHIKKSKKKL